MDYMLSGFYSQEMIIFMYLEGVFILVATFCLLIEAVELFQRIMGN